jgi:hypothetical protein
MSDMKIYPSGLIQNENLRIGLFRCLENDLASDHRQGYSCLREVSASDGEIGLFQ